MKFNTGTLIGSLRNLRSESKKTRGKKANFHLFQYFIFVFEYFGLRFLTKIVLTTFKLGVLCKSVCSAGLCVWEEGLTPTSEFCILQSRFVE